LSASSKNGSIPPKLKILKTTKTTGARWMPGAPTSPLFLELHSNQTSHQKGKSQCPLGAKNHGDTYLFPIATQKVEEVPNGKRISVPTTYSPRLPSSAQAAEEKAGDKPLKSSFTRNGDDDDDAYANEIQRWERERENAAL